MGKTRAELLAGMTQRELVEWMAFDELEPIGEFRADARNAMLCALLASAFGDPKQGRKPKPEDFMPWLPKEPADRADEDAARLTARLFKAGLGAIKLAPGEKPPGWTGEIG